MVKSYDTWLVLLSVIVAITASFVALDLGIRVSVAHRSRASRWLWILGGAVSMGTGIWSMHFIGMLAFRLPVRLFYDIPLTLLSGLPAIAASAVALFGVAQPNLSHSHMLIAAFFMAMGIVSMHYIGMAAMPMQPPIDYAPSLVAVSIGIALAASLAALWCAYRLRMETILSAFWKKAGSAVIMGTGIYGMHYTGMAAARFVPDSVCLATARSIDPSGLASALAGFTLMFLIATLLISAYDAYLANLMASRAGGLKQEVEVGLQVERALRQARAELEQRVAERTAELHTLSRRLVEVQESERRELARELHDRVGQNLTALGIDLEILKTRLSAVADAELQSRMEDSASLLEATVETIENVMAELRPPMLDDKGLFPAVDWYAKEFSKRTGINVVVSGEEMKVRLAPEVEIALFRIVQEALNNVAKHARAKRVEISLERSGPECVLSVSDDGVGVFQDAAPEARTMPGFGMASMRERAQVIGGRLEIHTAPGAGTRITVRVSC